MSLLEAVYLALRTIVALLAIVGIYSTVFIVLSLINHKSVRE